jgi:hypothetical protein
MDKTEFLNTLLKERAAFEMLLAEVPKEQKEVPGVEGNWSMKDLLAHISWYEREMVNLLESRQLKGSSLWLESPENRNQEIYVQNKHRPLSEILAESQTIFDQLLREVRAMKEVDLHEPGRYQGMPPEWVPWRVIAENSFLHYAQHFPAIQEWTQKKV